MTSVLILTAGYGEGHNAAARGLREGFVDTGVSAEVLDLFGPAYGEPYERSRRDYIRVVNERPWLWAGIYQVLDRVPFLGVFASFFRRLLGEFVRVLREKRPEVVVSVYPAYGYLFEKAVVLAGIPRPRFVTVVTDSITVNSVWYRCGSDVFLVPNEDTANVMLTAGLEREQVVVSGFPVSPRFTDEIPARVALGQGDRPKVLFMINGQSARAISLVERLLREDQVELTVTVGKDAVLGEELQQMAGRMGRSLTVLGWVTDVPGLIRSHHLLIGKAGGAMVQETLAAHTPMLITQILPGQEEGNARLLVQNGCGAVCPTNEAVVQTMAQLFENGAIGWNRMMGHTVRLGRPDAARETARWILKMRGDAKSAAGVKEGAFGVREV